MHTPKRYPSVRLRPSSFQCSAFTDTVFVIGARARGLGRAPESMRPFTLISWQTQEADRASLLVPFETQHIRLYRRISTSFTAWCAKHQAHNCRLCCKKKRGMDPPESARERGFASTHRAHKLEPVSTPCQRKHLKGVMNESCFIDVPRKIRCGLLAAARSRNVRKETIDVFLTLTLKVKSVQNQLFSEQP